MTRLRHGIWLLGFLLAGSVAPAQAGFRTVVPRQPVVAGEPFEVQYILENPGNAGQVVAPVFEGFRLAAGPHVYRGSLQQAGQSLPLVNTAYTLIARRPGKWLIRGARVVVDGREMRSNDAYIQVLPPAQAGAGDRASRSAGGDPSDYFLRPGEDPMEKIRRNLFLKVEVNRRSCYVGEPVVATFRLYSRLESRSDIVKNPGFYGFAVYDMINLDDKVQGIETIGGRSFDVHTIRQVQLYPLQAGRFVIDPMELTNRIEFSRSEVNRRTEQQIAEGVAGEEPAGGNPGTEVYETSLRTDPVSVEVRPLPARTHADSFNAGVGQFVLEARLADTSLARGQEGTLLVSLAGRGNFRQISAPVIAWPDGVESFEPSLADSLTRNQAPFSGRRTWQFGFLSTRPGFYHIPPIVFHYFDPASGVYRQLRSQPLAFQVSYRTPAERESHPPTASPGLRKRGLSPATWAALATGWLGLLAGLAWYWRKRRSRRERPRQREGISEKIPGSGPGGNTRQSVEDLLKPARMLLPVD
ncbi:MAG TPA: BatD family protein, partial [Chitinophagaceae bacterium]|nr:BatD family protein [Chitinophagaceae bacterium]